MSDTDNVVDIDTSKLQQSTGQQERQIQIDPNKQYTITLPNFAGVNVLLDGLGKLPAEESYDYINLIRNQVAQQNIQPE